MSYEEYLKPGKFIDSDHPAVIEYAKVHVGTGTTNTEKAL